MSALFAAWPSVAVVAAMSAALAALGSTARGSAPSGEGQRLYRWVLDGVTGTVILYLFLLLLHLLGVAWRPLVVVPLVVVLGCALWWLRHRTPRSPCPPSVIASRQDLSAAALGWGDAAALGCLLVLAWVALERWSVHPDLIYHWGLKAQRFAVVGGVDTDFLSRPWNVTTIHPAYPHLVPSLFALTARLLGGYQEGAVVLWTAVVYGAMLASTRQLTARAGLSGFGIQSTLALTAVATLMAGVGLQILGGPDWIIAALPLLSWPMLQRPGIAADRAMGWIAALGAGAKIEGIAMAAFLLAAYAVIRWRAHRRQCEKPATAAAGRPRRELAPLLAWLSRVGLPSFLVLAVWWWIGTRHGLFGHSYRGTFAPQWAGLIFAAALERLRLVPWHGLGWILFLLPALFVARDRALRAIGCVLALQLGFYLCAYFASPYETAEAVQIYVRSNFARLAFHLVPTLLVALGMLLDRALGQHCHPVATAAD